MKRTLAIALVLTFALSFTSVFAADKLWFDDFKTKGRPQGNRIDDVSNPDGVRGYWQNVSKRVNGAEATFANDQVNIKYHWGGPDDDEGEDGWAKKNWGSRWLYGYWGEAFRNPCAGIKSQDEDTVYYKYLNIKMKGAKGGEEKYLILEKAPKDEVYWHKYFEDLTLKGGGKPKITTGFTTLTIDLKASGFPQMTDRLQILSALKDVEITIDEIYYTEIDPSGVAPTKKGTYYADLEIKNLNKDGTPKDGSSSASGNESASESGSVEGTKSSPSTFDGSFLLYALAFLLISVGAMTFVRLRKSNS
ncbi:MAG: hypothetical protein FWH04_06850 [Oscillospiraceae bacterium]|nr:hypothetical protein [Oscillospiraceae bacterium]